MHQSGEIEDFVKWIEANQFFIIIYIWYATQYMDINDSACENAGGLFINEKL